jgi:hypothetical protein
MSESSYPELVSEIDVLDPTTHDCEAKISELRRRIDAASEAGIMTLSQWRYLLVCLAEVQTNCKPQPRSHP